MTVIMELSLVPNNLGQTGPQESMEFFCETYFGKSRHGALETVQQKKFACAQGQILLGRIQSDFWSKGLASSSGATGLSLGAR